MHDQILSGYLQDYKEQHGLNALEEADAFSQFATHCIITKKTGKIFSLDNLDVDGGQDTGLDAIAVIINGQLVNAKEDFDFFRKIGRVDVEFVFIQSKSSPKFDGAQMSNFIFGVKNFFKSTGYIPTNESIALFRELKDHIYKNSIHLNRSPSCSLFYVSSGKWTNDNFLCNKIDLELNDIRGSGLFSDVTFSPYDADTLKSVYRELRHKVEREVVFEKHTILPNIENVNEAYLGFLPLEEFIKLITNEAGEMQKGLFYDNVRDYQGMNSVNSEIEATLTSKNASNNFVLLNNGVTIVAKSISKIGAKFRLTDYQIVNGCQTSNVIYANKHKLTNSNHVYIPVKIISTSDTEVTNQIIKATNRQTEVKLEAFESLSPFHRRLEEFYLAFNKSKEHCIYYERRSKQYSNTPIPPSSIITLATQAQSFLGMFLNDPHSTHRYYGEILESYRGKLFVDNHAPYLYYVSGFAINRLEEFLALSKSNRKLKRYKYHILLIFRMLIIPDKYIPLGGKKADECAKNIYDTLVDKNKSDKLFHESTKKLEELILKFDKNFKKVDGNTPDRLRAFTDLIAPSIQPVIRGVTKYWNTEREFGFIETHEYGDVFAHSTAIVETLHRYLRTGDHVDFQIINTPRGLEAKNIKLIPKSTKV